MPARSGTVVFDAHGFRAIGKQRAPGRSRKAGDVPTGRGALRRSAARKVLRMELGRVTQASSRRRQRTPFLLGSAEGHDARPSGQRDTQRKEIDVSCISAHDPQLARLADAIAQRVGQQRFHVWFNNSTRLDLKHDGLEIAVPNDFISEWIGTHFKRPIEEAAHEVLGCSLPVRFSVVPQLFEMKGGDGGDSQQQSAGDRAVIAKVNGANGKKINGNGTATTASTGRSIGVAVASAVLATGVAPIMKAIP